MNETLSRFTRNLTPADQLRLLSDAGQEADGDDVRAALHHAREKFRASDAYDWAMTALIAARVQSLQQGTRFGAHEILAAIDLRLDVLDAVARAQIDEGLLRLRGTLPK